MEQKEKKLFNLDQDTIQILYRVKEEQGFKTDVKALTYIIKEYDRQSKSSISAADVDVIADAVVSKYNDTYYKFMERLRWSTQTAEQNSISMKDVLNTLLIRDNVEHCILPDVMLSPVIKTSLDYQKNKIEYYKQRKDDRKNRRTK